MTDYIKREDVLNAFNNAFYSGLAAKINEIPSEDVEPVVRCKVASAGRNGRTAQEVVADSHLIGLERMQMTFAVWEKGKTMTDYIKREDAIDYLVTNMNWFDADGIETSEEEKRADITELVNGVPSADVAPVRHGRWMPTDRYGFPFWECSGCGMKTDMSNLPYCPNCGARMDGENDE